jgi:lipopolysaccharide export LptBFGC system permease protein LptF
VTESSSTPPVKSSKKNAPTPKRKTQQAKNARPLVQNADAERKARKEKLKKLTPEERKKLQEDEKRASKAARQKRREFANENRINEQEALRGTGKAKFLPLRDQGPQKKFIRNWADTHRSLVEFFLPVAVVTLIVSSVVRDRFPVVSMVLTVVVYIYLFFSAINLFFLSRKLKKDIQREFGEDSTARGSDTVRYGIMRLLQPRFTRLPKVGV